MAGLGYAMSAICSAGISSMPCAVSSTKVIGCVQVSPNRLVMNART